MRCWKADIYSRAYAGDAAHKLDVSLAHLSEEMDDPALHIADARYQSIAAICDVVMIHPDRRAEPLHRRAAHNCSQPRAGLTDFPVGST
ncbi:hypothetical protein ACLK1Y_18825 [Escherichia coli]